MGGVIAEFTIRAADFAFGEALRTDPALEVEIERIVPTGEAIMPYVWVRNGDFEHFEAVVGDDDHVADLDLIDHRGSERLYRVQWTEAVHSLTNGIESTDGVLLHASGSDVWEYRIRFPDTTCLREFYEYLRAHDIPFQIQRLFDLSERPSEGPRAGLTPEQREAVLLAHERGYFDIPRQTSLVELARELDISDQACSERLRRGLDRLVSASIR